MKPFQTVVCRSDFSLLPFRPSWSDFRRIDAIIQLSVTTRAPFTKEVISFTHKTLSNLPFKGVKSCHILNAFIFILFFHFRPDRPMKCRKFDGTAHTANSYSGLNNQQKAM